MPKKHAQTLVNLKSNLKLVIQVLEQALVYPEDFSKKIKKGKTFFKKLSLEELLSWLKKADKIFYEQSGRHLWNRVQAKEKFGTGELDPEIKHSKEALKSTLLHDLQSAHELALFIYDLTDEGEASHRLKPKIVRKPTPPKTRKSRHLGKILTINGINAIDFDLTRSKNLQDPIIDMKLKLNNPISRLWAGIKRLWKKQKTEIALKFTIPLLVLPLVLAVAYRIWQGRGVNQEFSKYGVIHQVSEKTKQKDIFLTPSNNAYQLSYPKGFDHSQRILDQPVIVFGTYSSIQEAVQVEKITAWGKPINSPAQQIPSTSLETLSTWQYIWQTSKNYFNQIW